MSDEKSPRRRLNPIGPMYIEDFLEHLKQVSPISRDEVVAAIGAVRIYGPGIVQAEMLDRDVCRVRTLVGFGLTAVIEMERDRKGVLQPVFVEIIKL